MSDYTYADALCDATASARLVSVATRMTVATPLVGERIAIVWNLGAYAEPGSDFDYVTVVEINPYTMTVRVGWIGSVPMLMTFRRRTNLYAETASHQLIPAVREEYGVPLNYAA